ncbi:hypothetical protein [Nocardioides solisilvae]|uniref:hypothetical protein n=1 Tax=Nocardioides solisilvae TaxID=1542435 RepID=UPI001EF4CC0F|nr:hypothetical protein [Nocardioides solisilvae]
MTLRASRPATAASAALPPAPRTSRIASAAHGVPATTAYSSPVASGLLTPFGLSKGIGSRGPLGSAQ